MFLRRPESPAAGETSTSGSALGASRHVSGPAESAKCAQWASRSMGRAGSYPFAEPCCSFSRPPRPHAPEASIIHPDSHTYPLHSVKQDGCAPSQTELSLWNADTSLGFCFFVHMFLLFKLALNVFVSKRRSYNSVHCREWTHTFLVCTKS